jgi:Na+/H+ antiporter NhaA
MVLKSFHEKAVQAAVAKQANDVVREALNSIDDGLMVVFFLVVELEIKREIVKGKLSSFRHAALPILAALGGMILPALLYSALNRSGIGAHGWGISMATDIGFALGVLALLGKRIPSSLPPCSRRNPSCPHLRLCRCRLLFLGGGPEFRSACNNCGSDFGTDSERDGE